MQKTPVREFLKIWDKIADFEHLSDRGLCLKLGINPVTASAWRSGKTKTVRAHQLRAITEKLGYKIDVRANGSLVLQMPDAAHPRGSRSPQALQRSPRIGREQCYLLAPLATELRQTGDLDGAMAIGMFSPFSPTDVEGSVWFRIEDDSFKPMYLKGDALLLSKQKNEIQSGPAIVFVKGDDRPHYCRITVRSGKTEFLEAQGSQKSDTIEPSAIVVSYKILCAVYSCSHRA